MIKKFIGDAFDKIEKILMREYYFSLGRMINLKSRLIVLVKFIKWRLFCSLYKTEYEITALVCYEADERMLSPLIIRILETMSMYNKEVRVNLIMCKTLKQNTINKLRRLGCHIDKNHFSILRACFQPKGKVILLCLDQRYFYENHKWGVDAAETLRKFGVKTISMQHGGTRQDSVTGLASSASDILLVHGKRVWRDLIDKHHVNSSKLRLVGNPLHDRLLFLRRDNIIAALTTINPRFPEQIRNKKIVLMASSVHAHYAGYKDEYEMYRRYVAHVYNSIDFSNIFLIVQSHPADYDNARIYYDLIPQNRRESIMVIEPNVAGEDSDAYSLIYVSDLIITRASTIAEEALLLGKKVIAFDLIENGYSQHYRHLEEYGYYKTVIETPGKEMLRQEITDALFLPKDTLKTDFRNIEADITYRLDGNSTRRAVETIFFELEM